MARLRNEAARLRVDVREGVHTVRTRDAEIRRLANILRKVAADSAARRRELARATAERNVLGSQLIRRNDEAALLVEKVRLLHGALQRARVQYQARVDDVRVLATAVRDARRDLAAARNGAGALNGLERELIRSTRSLLTERSRAAALAEELENPMNVHRSRKLQGTDPATFEMIKKIQMSQQRLMRKAEEVVERDAIIEEKTQEYQDLKDYVSRVPSPNTIERTSRSRSVIKDKTRQVMALKSELKMSELLVSPPFPPYRPVTCGVQVSACLRYPI